MEDNLKTQQELISSQMTEAHALAATQESVEHKTAMLQEPNAETPVLVHEAFVQTEDMVQGTPVLM